MPPHLNLIAVIITAEQHGVISTAELTEPCYMHAPGSCVELIEAHKRLPQHCRVHLKKSISEGFL